MKKFIIGIILGIILGSIVNSAYAKYESGSSDAASIVGYGNYNSTIVALAVDSNGYLILK